MDMTWFVRQVVGDYAMTSKWHVASLMRLELGMAAVLLVIQGCGRPADNNQPQAKDSAVPVADTKPALPNEVQVTDAERGPALYAQHCAACHGDKGNGQGLAARFLYPKPRDFRTGRFRLISTANGVPTIGDLLSVIERGMPGSAMIPWEHLSKADRELLAQEVIRFRQAGARDVELQLAAEADEERTSEELDEAVKLVTTPGDEYQVPAFGSATAESIANGKRLYIEKGCAACHGPTGKGDGQQNMVDAEGLATRPRNLLLGIFKGRPDPESVFRRIWLGMPGTPMPSSQQLTTEQVADLTSFVLSLSDQAARDRAVLRRQSISAKHVTRAPIDINDGQWQSVSPVRLNTTPVWWRDQPDPELDVRVFHDDATIAIRLDWIDETWDQRAERSESFKDAAAVELFSGTAEPFVGMGTRESPVDVWMWDADRERGSRDVEEANPNMVVDIYPFSESAVASAEFSRPGTDTAAQAPISFPARLAGNGIMRTADAPVATSLEAGGPGTLTFRPPENQSVVAHSQWQDGHWTVVMHRPMTADARGIKLTVGERLSLACAVWDGAHDDRDGQKRFTIWHDLILEPK